LSAFDLDQIKSIYNYAEIKMVEEPVYVDADTDTYHLPDHAAGTHDPRSPILPDHVGDSYLQEAWAHQNQFPRQLSARELDEFAIKKAEKIEASRAEAGRAQITAAQAEAIVRPPVIKAANALAKIGTTAGYNQYQQDRAVVARVHVGNLLPEEVLTAMREAVLLAGQYVALETISKTAVNLDDGNDETYDEPKYNTRGSTLAMAVVRGRHVYTASVGDSSVAIVAEDDAGNVVGRLLHKIHTPKDPAELARIRKFLADEDAAVKSVVDGSDDFIRAVPDEVVRSILEHGKIGDVTTSRALGDIKYAQDGLIYTPEVSHYQLPANFRHGRVAVYSSGISDVFTEIEVAEKIISCCNVEPNVAIGAILCQSALIKLSPDNATAIVSNPLVDTPVGLEEESALLVVLDGHGENSEELVDWLSVALPTLVQSQLDRLEFLKQKLEQINAERTRKLDHISKGHPLKSKQQLTEELTVLLFLERTLNEFKVAGCYHDFDKQIGRIIANVFTTVMRTESCANGFKKIGYSPCSPRLVRLCQSIQKEARQFADDGFPPEPRKDKGCVIS
jgi:serine/threonine protein phosphatase PrpC